MTESSTNNEKSSIRTTINRNCFVAKDQVIKLTVGEEVLSRWSDGLLYLGIILEIDNNIKKCLLRFEDSSEYWIKLKDIYRGPCKGSDIVCSVCTGGVSEPPNEIVICDNCGVGYHQNCHTPRIPSNTILLDADWHCRQCVFAFTAKKGGAVSTGAFARTMQTMKQTLPYDLKLLTWDSQHKTNKEEIYCYCGGPGEWYINMLQCCQCKQWFHEACIQCLEKPLLFGDRFYKFICAVCNSGPEFLERFNLSWLDAVHLVLFNLTILHNKTYFDIKRDILTFLEEHWDAMQLQGTVAKSDPNKRPIIVKDILDTNRTRFKSGREIKKSTNIWGLRSRVPPQGPKINLSTENVMSDKSTSQFKQDQGQTSNSSKSKKRKSTNDTEANSFPSSTPPNNLTAPGFSVKKIRERLRSALQSPPGSGAGMKKGMPHDPKAKIRKMASKHPAHQETCTSTKKLNPNARSKKKGRPPKKTQSKRTTCTKAGNPATDSGSNSVEEVSLGMTLDSIIPPPSSFEGINNPFRDESKSFHPTSQRQPQQSANVKEIAGDSDAKVKVRHNPNGIVKSNDTSKSEKPDNAKNCCKKFTFNGHGSEICRWKRTAGSTIANGQGHTKRSGHRSSSKELWSSFNKYFSTNNGNANKRKFKILASRLTHYGKVQYLVEWEKF